MRSFLSRTFAPKKIECLGHLVSSRPCCLSAGGLRGLRLLSSFNFSNTQSELQSNNDLKRGIFALYLQKKRPDPYFISAGDGFGLLAQHQFAVERRRIGRAETEEVKTSVDLSDTGV